MKKIRIDYVERKFHEFVSLEKAFRQIEKCLDKDKFETSFEQLPFLNTAAGMIKNLLVFRPKKGADVYHITGHAHYIALLFPRRNTILSIMDLRFLGFGRGLRRYFLKKLYLDLPVKKLDYITAISEQTKREIVFHTGCDPEKVRVLDLPLLDHLSDQHEEWPFNSRCPRILQVGTTTNKNIPNLAKALSGLTCKLVVIGRMDQVQLSSLRENEVEFENSFDLDDAELREEYKKADVVAFCSTYEGFGLPIIEAQAMRKPVMTSDLSPMKETSGRAAMLVDPHDPLSIRDGLLKLVADSELRRRLIEAGLRNIGRFTPEKVAESYAELYKEIAAKNSADKPAK